MLKMEDIVLRLAAKGYTKRAARCVINDVVLMLTECLVEGESVMLHGFGTFEVYDTAERESIDVCSGERIKLRSHRHPRFVAGKRLKRYVRDGRIID